MEKGMNVVFYEWSDINRTPIHFGSNNEFFDFCHNSGIKLTTKNRNFISDSDCSYAVCKKNKAELILSKDYMNLRKNFSKHRND